MLQLRRNSAPQAGDKFEQRRIGVHCVAGLGRAPFLVAIALVNNGCTPANAIELIRKNRPGAFNINQANYILEFKGMNVKKGKSKNNASC
jgi:protein tyrosine phosphatase type 4A